MTTIVTTRGWTGHICGAIAGNRASTPTVIGVCSRHCHVYASGLNGQSQPIECRAPELLVQLSLVSKDHDTAWQRASRMSQVSVTQVQTLILCQVETLTSFACSHLGWHSAAQVTYSVALYTIKLYLQLVCLLWSSACIGHVQLRLLEFTSQVHLPYQSSYCLTGAGFGVSVFTTGSAPT